MAKLAATETAVHAPARRTAKARLTEPRIGPARSTVALREAMKQPASFAPA